MKILLKKRNIIHHFGWWDCNASRFEIVWFGCTSLTWECTWPTRFSVRRGRPQQQNLSNNNMIIKLKCLDVHSTFTETVARRDLNVTFVIQPDTQVHGMASQSHQTNHVVELNEQMPSTQHQMKVGTGKKETERDKVWMRNHSARCGKHRKIPG